MSVYTTKSWFSILVVNLTCSQITMISKNDILLLSSVSIVNDMLTCQEFK